MIDVHLFALETTKLLITTIFTYELNLRKKEMKQTKQSAFERWFSPLQLPVEKVIVINRLFIPYSYWCVTFKLQFHFISQIYIKK